MWRTMAKEIPEKEVGNNLLHFRLKSHRPQIPCVQQAPLWCIELTKANQAPPSGLQQESFPTQKQVLYDVQEESLQRKTPQETFKGPF